MKKREKEAKGVKERGKSGGAEGEKKKSRERGNTCARVQGV